jgi:hypothetical protein
VTKGVILLIRRGEFHLLFNFLACWTHVLEPGCILSMLGAFLSSQTEVFSIEKSIYPIGGRVPYLLIIPSHLGERFHWLGKFISNLGRFLI